MFCEFQVEEKSRKLPGREVGGDSTGCGGYCETELKICSLLWVTRWKICVNALVPWAAAPSSSSFPLPAKEVTAKHTQQVHPAAGDTADLRAGEMEGQRCNVHAGRKGLELTEENSRSLYREQTWTIP